MTTTAARRRSEEFADTDCILITDAGIEALTSAPTVPDEPEENKAEDTAETFTPDTAEKVDWVLGKIAERRAAAGRIRENAELMAREQDREAARPGMALWTRPASLRPQRARRGQEEEYSPLQRRSRLPHEACRGQRHR